MNRKLLWTLYILSGVLNLFSALMLILNFPAWWILPMLLTWIPIFYFNPNCWDKTGRIGSWL